MDECAVRPASPWRAEDTATWIRRALNAIWNEGRLDLADELFAPAYRNHGGVIPDLVRGPEAIKVSVALYRAAFPRLRLVMVDLLTQASIVALHWIAYPDAADDESIARSADRADPLRGMTFARLDDGQIVESWTSWERQRDDDRRGVVAAGDARRPWR
jgi:predicted SnoaL-like aldol condensation-catalyzing enzyme